MTVILNASFDQTLWYRLPGFCGRIAGFWLGSGGQFATGFDEVAELHCVFEDQFPHK